MNKVTGFASPGIVRHCISMPFIFVLSTLTVLLFTKPIDIFLLCIFTLGSAVIFLIAYLFNRNAFVRYEINEKGIKNKYIAIAWDEIGSVAWTDDITIGKYRGPRIEVDAVFCINGTGGDFYIQDPRKCVFLTKNKKNFDALRNYSYGKSKILDEFLDMYG